MINFYRKMLALSEKKLILSEIFKTNGHEETIVPGKLRGDSHELCSL
jgi:hypothetical protein